MNDQQDPFNEGRIISGRVRDQRENFTFTLWGRRPASRAELEQAHHFWLIHEGAGRDRQNLRIDVPWNW